MNYLAGVPRKDPPKPKVCITAQGDIIIVNPALSLSILQLRDPATGLDFGPYYVILTANGSPCTPDPTLHLQWNGCTGPATMQTPGSIQFVYDGTFPAVINCMITCGTGTQVIVLYAGI